MSDLGAFVGRGPIEVSVGLDPDGEGACVFLSMTDPVDGKRLTAGAPPELAAAIAETIERGATIARGLELELERRRRMLS